MREFLSFYWSVLVLAFGDLLSQVSTVLLFLFLALGFIGWLNPGLSVRGYHANAEITQTWWFVVIVLTAVLFLRLVLTIFWMWQDEHARRISAENAVKLPINVTFETANDTPFLQPDSGGQLWIRARAHNSSATDVLCRVFLNSLEKVGEAKPLWSGEPLQLVWAGTEYESPGNVERTVSPGPLGKIFNLAFIKRGGNEISMQPSQFAAQIRAKILPGSYKFTVQANYGTCRSDPTDIWVKYEGKQKVSFIDAPSDPNGGKMSR